MFFHCGMLRPFRYGCERMQVNTEPPSQPRDAVNIWHLPVKMSRGVVETEADPAGKLVEKNIPAAAPRALEPRKCPVGPDHQDSVPVD